MLGEMERYVPCCHKSQACWGARYCLQAHQIFCQVCSSRVGMLVFATHISYVVEFVADLASLQPHEARLLELS